MLEEIKEEPEQQQTGPRIVLCAPGEHFHKDVVMDLTRFLFEAKNAGWDVVFSMDYDPNVYYVRNKLLGGDVGRGPSQKPFDGKIDYDYVLWIDSDIRFTFKMVQKLLSHKKDVVCGIYRMKDLKNFAVVKDMDDAYFAEHKCYKFYNIDDFKKSNEENNLDPFKVDYTGMGMCLVSKKALESLEYPWFRPIWMNINEMKDFTSEDVGFCVQLRKAGFEIWCDPAVVAGHVKSLAI